MKHIQKKISQELNISKSTISKALNHCGGVDYMTKEKITDVALKYGYRRSISTNVGLVMPSKPKFFWHEMRKSIVKYMDMEESHISLYLYSSLYSEKEALNCINEALNTDISVLVVVAPDSAEIKKLLSQYSDKMFIILLEEDVDVVNAFYIGEDRFKTGYLLAKAYAEKYKDAKNFVFVTSGMDNGTLKRTEGFKKALSEKGIHDVVEINIGTFDETKLLPSLIARELSQYKSRVECIVCFNYITKYAEMAINKLKEDREIHCIGFEQYIEKGETVKFVVCQDIDAQAKETALQVKKYLQEYMYPERKYTFVESKLLQR